jgi:thiosulfate/3-mercaptopyruvate sulfurtransferase
MRRKKIASFVIIGVFSLVISVANAAEYANPQLLVTPAAMSNNMGKWVVIDCREEKDYAAGHIPGSITLGGACGKVLRDATLRAKKVDELEKVFGNAGVDRDRPVVVYADARLITSATVAFWILEYLGHDNVYFLNGGIEEWQSDGRPLDKAEAKHQTAAFKAKVVKSRIATTEEIVKIAKREIKDVNLIDSRSEKEHSGSDIRALRGGYIPNTTLNVPHVKTYDVQTGKLHPMDEMEKLLDNKLDKNRRTIAYCQTGTRSTLIYLELRLIGFKDPANYDDSWIVYGSNVDYPVANENWYDFVRVNEAIKSIEDLQKEIGALKAR